MPRIFYTADKYQAPYQNINTNGEQHLYCRKLDLYRSIITVGSPSFISWREIRQNGLFRTISNSIIQKVLMVQANIESNPNGMNLHPVFHNYVSDQKRIVSYNLGMAFAKFYAEQLLDIPNLTHLETLKKINAVNFVQQQGRTKEPDLVGITNNGEWHVFEAKGMSNNKLITELEKAKIQAQQIDTIHGQNPATLSACATFLGNDRIISVIEDPDSFKNKKIEIQKEKFFEGYYNSFFAFRELLKEESKKETFENISFQSFEIKTNKLDLSIGLETEVYELLQQQNYDLIEVFYNSRKQKIDKVKNYEENIMSIGLDGFVVKYKNY